MTFAAVVVLGYLLGSCPWGYWLVRLIRHEDIRAVGSGNIGATNVWRTYGRWLGVPVVLLDTLKGFAPALLGMLFAKGGKMVATCAGVFFGVAVWVALTGLLAWLVTFLLFRYASLASIVAGISLPVMAAVYGYPMPVVVFGAGAAVAILYLHRTNLRRLRAGTEHRFRLRRPASA